MAKSLALIIVLIHLRPLLGSTNISDGFRLLSRSIEPRCPLNQTRRRLVTKMVIGHRISKQTARRRQRKNRVKHTAENISEARKAKRAHSRGIRLEILAIRYFSASLISASPQTHHGRRPGRSSIVTSRRRQIFGKARLFCWYETSISRPAAVKSFARAREAIVSHDANLHEI